MRGGKLVEVHKTRRAPVAPAIMIDAYSKNPILSPVDGKPITHRGELTEHNKRNEVLDVGNDAAMTRERKWEYPTGLRDDLERAYSEHDA